MAPDSRLGQTATQEDLSFLQNIKTVTADKDLVLRDHGINKDLLQRDHGMRRNSSFADYFEGDLSQNLLSRSHFSHRDSGGKPNSSVFKTDIQLPGRGEEGEKKLKKLSLPQVNNITSFSQ